MIKKLMNISGAQVLGKEEQKCIVGGLSVICECNDGSANWEGEYSDWKHAERRAAYWYGEGGGTCIPKVNPQ